VTSTELKTVTVRLRDEILAGTFMPGDRLVELTLTERYEVGRAAIRAALVELNGEGLVTREENRGAVVRRITLAEAIEITEARAALEGVLARLAAERCTAPERAELKKLVVSMGAAVRAGAPLEYARLNQVLHRRLREIADHSVIDGLVANLRNRASHHQYRLATVVGRSAASLLQHRAIVKAVISGDGDAAETAMRAHLGSVADTLRHWQDLDRGGATTVSAAGWSAMRVEPVG
jgi:DNA-binding GntR family transcriptional regulator